MPIPTSASYVLIRSSLSGLGSGDGFSPMASPPIPSLGHGTAQHGDTDLSPGHTRLSRVSSRRWRPFVFDPALLETTVDCEHDIALLHCCTCPQVIPTSPHVELQMHVLGPCRQQLPSSYLVTDPIAITPPVSSRYLHRYNISILSSNNMQKIGRRYLGTASHTASSAV